MDRGWVTTLRAEWEDRCRLVACLRIRRQLGKLREPHQRARRRCRRQIWGGGGIRRGRVVRWCARKNACGKFGARVGLPLHSKRQRLAIGWSNRRAPRSTGFWQRHCVDKRICVRRRATQSRQCLVRCRQVRLSTSRIGELGDRFDPAISNTISKCQFWCSGRRRFWIDRNFRAWRSNRPDPEFRFRESPCRRCRHPIPAPISRTHTTR